MSVAGFTCKQLASTQVQGAREREQHQVELHQLFRRWKHVEQQWNDKLQADNTLEDDAMYYEAVAKAFEKKDPERDVSPFMIARLANLCRKEYRVIQFEKGLRRIHNDNRVLINSMYQQSELFEKENEQVKAEATWKVEEARAGLVKFEQRKVQELREGLEWKTRELLALREQARNKQREKEHQLRRIQAAMETARSLWVDQSDWVDIDDDFGHAAASEWVLCS
jgi:hypothetical protein